MSDRRITFVVGGGGVKAAAGIGAARVAGELGLTPARYVGTSMGAVMAALLATGAGAADAARRLLAAAERPLGRPTLATLARGIFAPALLKADRLEELITGLLPVARFDQLAFPLTVTATDVDSGALVLFGDGGEDVPLVVALSASCALPVYLPPRVVGTRRLADGGLRSVLPLEVAAGFPADRVIAVDTGSGFDELPSTGSPPPALIGAHDQAIGILMAEQTRQALAYWRAMPGRPPLSYIRPPVERGATFRADQIARYLEAGEHAARAALALTLPPA
jgi:NTE family protein